MVSTVAITATVATNPRKLVCPAAPLPAGSPEVGDTVGDAVGDTGSTFAAPLDVNEPPDTVTVIGELVYSVAIWSIAEAVTFADGLKITRAMIEPDRRSTRATVPAPVVCSTSVVMSVLISVCAASS